MMMASILWNRPLSKAELKRQKILTEEIRAKFAKVYSTNSDDLVRLAAEWIGRNISPASDAPGHPDKVTLVLEGIVSPIRPDDSGVLVESTALVWMTIAKIVKNDLNQIFEIPPRKMEEFMAATYHQAGFDVVLTPNSKDYGVDLIATKAGIGSIKILGSVKAYRRDHLVGYEAVRSLLGVVAAEPTASKGVIITTSGFRPRILQDKYIARHLPTRLELMDGVTLQRWLSELLQSKGL